MEIIRDLLGLFSFISNIYEQIKNFFIPQRAFAWQTLIYLSIFSWLMSSLSTGIVKSTIALCGWVFLIAGTAWYTTENPLLIPGTNMPVGALVTGFLVSAFAFGNSAEVLTSRTLVFWPTISAFITAAGEFFEGTGTDVNTQIPKVEDREKIIILVASCMVISCWLQFGFTVNRWLQEFPSLRADNFSNNFVIRITEPLANKIPENGVEILKKLEPLVKEQIANRPWSEVEQWLLGVQQRVTSLGTQVIQTSLGGYEERYLWRLEPRVYNLKSGGYTLDLLSIWSGPTSTGLEYYLKQSCQIEPLARSTNSSANNRADNGSLFAEINCGQITKPIPGPPPPLQ
ncbi:MAG: septal junction protein FraD [Fischerella sp.]|nr:septal junction protein FraD [Fischerella sp.]